MRSVYRWLSRALGLGILLSAPLAIAQVSGGGVINPGTPTTSCGDATHAIGWSGSKWLCQLLSGGGTPGGTNGQIQYNNSGAFGGLTAGGSCTNQAVTSVNSSLIPSCSTITSSYVDTSIAKTGADINTSNQVTKTSGVSFAATATSTDAANLTGIVSVNRFNSGTNASATTVLYGNGTWADPAAVLQVKPTATAATTAALPTNVYANGSSGVGATLTGVSLGALSVDSYSPAVGDLILVKNEAAGANNGLYSVTAAGSGAAVYVLTRQVDMNVASEFSGSMIPVGNSGTTNANSLWLANPVTPVTVGTTSIPFTQLNGATDLIAGTGITISGNTVSLTTPVTAANGGSGAATLTSHGVLLGHGTSAFTAVAAMAADTLLQGQGASADPLAVALTNCADATHALAYSTSTHAFSCQALTVGTAEDIQIFTATGANTWTKPSGSPLVTHAICKGAGGGGGSGAVVASGTAVSGGGGGGGAGDKDRWFSTASLGATETVTIGTGGTAGAAVTSTNAGNTGGAGGNTTFGSWMTAYGAGPGSGGASAAVSTGGGSASAIAASTTTNGASGGGQGGGSGASGNTASNSTAGGGGGGDAAAGNAGSSGGNSDGGGSGGGSGGGITTAPAASAGGTSGFTGILGTVAGGAIGTVGTVGATSSAAYAAGTGGGGGGSSITGTAGTGGAGARGGGGGGGGAALNGTGNSGAGGVGGNGYCAVITTY